MSDLLSVLQEPGQPLTLFKALHERLNATVGFGLFTLLFVDGQEVARVYSSNEQAYPVFGRKAMGPTPWGDLVLKRQQPFLGRDMEAIRWAFYDHELIASLGLGCVINVPVLYNGETIGTMNLLDAEHRYSEADLAQAVALAPLLVPAFLSARFGQALSTAR